MNFLDLCRSHIFEGTFDRWGSFNKLFLVFTENFLNRCLIGPELVSLVEQTAKIIGTVFQIREINNFRLLILLPFLLLIAILDLIIIISKHFLKMGKSLEELRILFELSFDKLSVCHFFGISACEIFDLSRCSEKNTLLSKKYKRVASTCKVTHLGELLHI